MRNVAFIAVLFLAGACCTGRTIYVDASGPNDPGTGSYEDPFRRIQEAIDDPNTKSGDIIEIRSGIYTGEGNYDLDPHGLALTIRSTAPNEPGIVAATIIDAGGAGRGFYFSSGEDANCVVCGLTMTGARIAGFGGAIFCNDSSPTIVNCVITGNFAQWYGGAVYCSNSQLRMNNCIISNNSSGQDGAGLECWWASVTLTNCIISNNRASGKGGGIDGYGGSNLFISNCTIVGNWASSGGGIFCDNSEASVTNSIMWANESDPDQGPQMAAINTSKALIKYCDIGGGSGGVSVAPNCTLTWDANNIDTDPCFASFVAGGDANTWDLHLRSVAGRFDSNTRGWVNDVVTSGCVDFGDPSSDWHSEPWPNGKRINIGAYGGTKEASKNGNPADFNVDETVDFVDFAWFSGQWLIEDICIEDLSRDGVVEFADLASFCANWLWYRE